MKGGRAIPAFAALALLHGCADAGDGAGNIANRANAAPETSAPIATVVENSAPAQPSAPPAPTPPPAKSTPAKPDVPPAADYRALGTEPFWAIIVKGGQATLTRPGYPPLTFAVSFRDDGLKLRFHGDGLTMTITPGPCSDGMSDALYMDHVQVAFAQGILKGCGGKRSEPGNGDDEDDNGPSPY